MENIIIPKTIVMEAVMYDADKRRKKVEDEPAVDKMRHADAKKDAVR